VALVFDKLTKSFGSFRALDDVSLTITDGEFLALLGPSGSGKTTLLRILAGLEVPDFGAITLNGEDFAGRNMRQRQAGFVFQHYALFRHMTVAQNIAFGLQVRKAKERPVKKEIKRRVGELLDLVQLGNLGARYPSQLSGGQRQRVALARALAIEPKLLLLDEPFGALDAKVRKELRRWLRRLHREMGLTSIFVTHDQEEAFDLADKVAIMNRGRIEQIGPPDELYRAPANAFVYDFLGGVNKLPVDIDPSGKVAFQGYAVERPDLAGIAGAAVAYVRAEDIEIGEEQTGGIPATVEQLFRAGAAPRAELRLDSGAFVDAILATSMRPLVPGDRVALRPRTFRVFAQD
jgi:sulfate transport system ATP-binding protein